MSHTLDLYEPAGLLANSQQLRVPILEFFTSRRPFGLDALRDAERLQRDSVRHPK